MLWAILRSIFDEKNMRKGGHNPPPPRDFVRPPPPAPIRTKPLQVEVTLNAVDRAGDH
jgi:hypothetical protein